MKMTRDAVGSSIVICVAVFALGFSATATQPEVLIKWRHASPSLGLSGATSRSALQTTGAQFRRSIGPGWELAVLPEGTNPQAWLEAARGNPSIAHVELNRRYHLLATVNDRLFPRLHGLSQIGAPMAWDTTNGNPDVVIAVFDTGINLTHPDLAPVLWVNTGEIPGNGLDDDSNGFVDDVHGADFVVTAARQTTPVTEAMLPESSSARATTRPESPASLTVVVSCRFGFSQPTAAR